jgi:hypothetical protein
VRDYDSKFFEAHPDRQYRLRMPEPEEFTEFHIGHFVKFVKGKPYCPAIAVKKWTQNGYLLFTRIAIALPAKTPLGAATEEQARHAFERSASMSLTAESAPHGITLH